MAHQRKLVILGQLLIVFRLASFPAAAVCQDASNPDTTEKTEQPAPEWHKALVRVTYPGAVQPMTGVVVHATEENALILTTKELVGISETGGAEGTCMVSATGSDRQIYHFPGKIVGGRYSQPQLMSRDSTVYQVIVEVVHNNLTLNAVTISDSIPKTGDSVFTVSRHCGPTGDASPVMKSNILGAVDSPNLIQLTAEVSGSQLRQQNLLTIHDDAGQLIGIGTTIQSIAIQGSRGFGGYPGGGGVGYPGQSANMAFGSDNHSPPPLTFMLAVDIASELRELGLPVSDAALKLQTQRQRIRNDKSGRPVSTASLMVSWSDNHRELHGFSTELGTWSKIHIDEQDIITPVVADHVAAVSLKDAVAAYSAKKGVWDVLTLPAGSNAVPVVSSEVVKVQDGKQHYTFAASSGRWTSPTDDSLTIEKREFFTSHLDPGKAWERIREQLLPNVIADDAFATGAEQVERSSFFVTAPRRHLDAIAAILQKVDTAENAKAWNAVREVPTVYVTRSFQFQHVSPQQLLPHVDDALKAAKTTRYMVNSRELGVTASVEGMQQLEEVFRRLDTPENAKQWKPVSPHELRALMAEHSLRSGSHMPGSDVQNLTLPGTSSEQLRGVFVPVAPPSRTVLDNKPSTPNMPEQQSLELARTLRSAKTVTDEQRAELTLLVEQSLEARLKRQAEQVEQLRAKLQQVEKALQDRQQNKDRMIQRRVEELLDPNIDWNSVARERTATEAFAPAIVRRASNFRSPNPFRTSPRGDGISEFSRALAGERSQSGGTPIGLPGPPHLPLSKPAEFPPLTTPSKSEGATGATP